MNMNEYNAFCMSLDKAQLRKRLLRARWALASDLRARFGRKRVDHAHKRMLSDDAKLMLQWQTRECPELPESYTNQQTSMGTVKLRRVQGTDRVQL